MLVLRLRAGMLGCSLWSLARSLVLGSWHLGIWAPGLALDTLPPRETSNPNLGASPTRLTGRISCCEMTTSTARATPRRQDPTAGKPLPASVGNSKFKADTRGSDPRHGNPSTETLKCTQGLTRSHSSELLSCSQATGEPQREPRCKGTPGAPRHLALPFIHTGSFPAPTTRPWRTRLTADRKVRASLESGSPTFGAQLRHSLTPAQSLVLALALVLSSVSNDLNVDRCTTGMLRRCPFDHRHPPHVTPTQSMNSNSRRGVRSASRR